MDPDGRPAGRPYPHGLPGGLRHEPMKPETNLLRELPSVDRVMSHPAAAPLLERFSRPFVTDTLRDLIDELRQVIKSGHDLPPDRLHDESIITDLEKKLAVATRPGMVRVVNASGTILHTNLGRALLSEAAAEAVGLVARHPVNLEFDLRQGKRGRRESAIESLLRELTGAEAAAVVNNNAAAVLLGSTPWPRASTSSCPAASSSRSAARSASRRSWPRAAPCSGRWAPPTVRTRGTTPRPSTGTPACCSRCTPATTGWWALPPRWNSRTW